MHLTEFELERLLLAKVAQRECQNLIARYCHYRSACRDRDILAIWSNQNDTRVEMPWGVYDGKESVERFYAQECVNHEDLENRKGYLFVDALSTPVIQVAADLKTARGAWFSQGVRSNRAGEEVSADWRWTKLAVDFIYEDGSWKIWHLAVYPLLDTPYDVPWYDAPKLTQEDFADYHPDRAPTARYLWSFHEDNRYPLGHPVTPKPYDNFDLDVGYGY
jgi:hypothetical protein